MKINTKTQQFPHSKLSGKYWVLIFALTTLLISLMDLLGWIFSITILKSLEESWVPMKIIGAICFVLASVAMIIINTNTKWRPVVYIPVLFGICIFVIGLLSCWIHIVLLITGTESSLAAVHFFNLFLSIDNRMALLTAANFSFLGIIIILLSFHNKKLTDIAHIIILPVLAVSYLIPVTYLLGVLSLHTVNHLSVALNSGIASTSICIAVLFINTKSWFMKVFTSHNSGGLMARRLLPWLLTLPVAIAWIRMYGERKDFFESEVGVLLVALTYTICLIFLTWISARSVNRIDKKRHASDEAMGRSEEKLQTIFTSMNEGLVYNEVIYNNGKAVDYTIIEINPAFEKITGLNRDVVIGARATKIYMTEEPPYLDIYAHVAKGGGSQCFETYIPDLKKHFEISVFSPEKGKFVTVFSDITYRKKAEAVLQKSHEELELLVKERTAELTQANSMLEEEISERNKAEEAIKAERKRFNDVLELLPAYLILLSDDYRVPYANKYFRDRFGESHGKRCYEYLFNRTEPCEICETFNVFKTGMPLTWEWTGPDDRNYSIFDFPFTDVDGSKMVMEMGIDVTELKKSEAEVRELNTFLEHKVVERTGDVIKANEQHKRSQEMAHLGSWELDLETNKFIWSDEVYRIFGLKPQEFAPTYEDFLEAVHPDDRVLANKTYKESIKDDRESFELNHRVLKKHSGEIRFVHEKCEHVRNNEGIITRSIGMIHDITEQVESNEKLKQSEENYHKLFEFSAIPIWKEDYSEIKKFFDKLKISGVKDFRKYFEDHREDVIHLASLVKVVEINHKSIEFYGAENKDDVIKSMLFYFNEDSFDIFREELIALASGEKQFECEMPMRTLSGDVKLLDLHLSVVKGFEDTLSNILVSFIDITERKRFENELKEKNEALKESNATKDKFFKIIAHDMKNPFISLLGASELLCENVYKYDLTKIAEFARIMNDSAKGGYDMLMNLLSWAKSQAGSMLFQPEKINLIELIDRNLSNLNEFAANKKIILIYNIAGDFEIFADKNMLITILRNLINNSIKYTPSGGEVVVSTKEEAGSVVVLIKDTGVGIKENDFEKLFRTDIKFSLPGTDHEGGTGLGLILCKELVEKHSGKIWVESQVGKGSVFYFTVPAKIE